MSDDNELSEAGLDAIDKRCEAAYGEVDEECECAICHTTMAVNFDEEPMAACCNCMFMLADETSRLVRVVRDHARVIQLERERCVAAEKRCLDLSDMLTQANARIGELERYMTCVRSGHT